MSKPKYAKIIFCCILLTIGVWHGHGQAQSQLAQPKSEQSSTLDIGRNNPFAKITRVKKSIPQEAFQSSQSDEESPELFLETITLKFLDAKNLKQAMNNMSSMYGSITVSPKTNSLIVCDTKENLARVLAKIKEADKKPQQLMIEVVILDVQLDDDTEIGINWDILSDRILDISYRQNFSTRLGTTTSSPSTTGITPFNTTGTGGDVSIVFGNIREVVHLLQEKRDVEILASPRVMMLSGESANIEAVDEIPYTESSSTSGGGALTFTAFKNVGVKLTVTATLTDGNDILLTVDTEQNVQVGTTTPPRVDTRKARTSLLLKDGEVVVFGGLRRQEKTKEVDQIPILGDLPIIGGLFKSTNTVVKNSELIVFLSPHIYKGEPIPEEEMAKFNEISKRPLLSLPPDKDNNEWFPRADKQPREQ